MNDKKICFIMCSNDEFLANECLIYIEQLTVPDGFHVETMVVREAKSMTEGYNHAMNSSDAKYKIYLHQDVLLIHKNLLKEIISLFTNHPEIGMLGVVGNTSLPEDGCPWSDGSERRIGELLSDLIDTKAHCMFQKATGDYQPVIVLDGLFIATQYDIPWREDLFKGWDFYDCSQSIEFWKAGYQVIVPYMDSPWCLHDNDINNLENYDKWRTLFLEEYYDFFTKWNTEHKPETHIITTHEPASKQLDPNKVAFIICYNNELYFQECTDYISLLKIPDNITIDIISISDADSIASAYNAAMQGSDAKYKVYLHQDVFILNENFISDIINAFKTNPEYGLLGVLGTDTLIEDACYWDRWNIGLTYTCNALKSIKISAENPESIKEVSAIDGMIMITQYDVIWREDIFDGFDFYDVSQCAEFIKYGYKLGIPHQDSVWCLHDCGASKFANYNHYRRLFCDTYADMGYKYNENEELNLQNALYAEAENLILTIEHFIALKDIDSAQKILIEIMDLGCFSTQICYLYILCNIMLLEADAETKSIFKNTNNPADLVELLTIIKFALRRLEYNKPGSSYTKLFELLLHDIHKPFVALQEIIDHFIFDKMTVINKLSQLSCNPSTVTFKAPPLPLVTVLISVYNAEAFIEDTLLSVMQQSYSNLQIVVVDDCSLDGSREIIDKLAAKDRRIERLYLPKNSHVCKATNEGYKLAKGKYIALIGHDDIWQKNKIEKQVAFMELNSKYAVAFTLCNIIDEHEQVCNDSCFYVYDRLNQNNRSQFEWVNSLFFYGNVLCAPSALIRKSAVKTTHLYQFGLLQLQDYALWLNLLIDAPIYIIPERLTLYRQFLNGRANLSSSNNEALARHLHETAFILKKLLDNISATNFIKYFSNVFANPNSTTPEELVCEKAMLLLKTGNHYCIDAFMELFEDDVSRDILENTFNFSLLDFYKVNTNPFQL